MLYFIVFFLWYLFYDLYLLGMLWYLYFISKIFLFIFIFWYYYERNGNYFGCIMWGKEWNNVNINRKCIILKCLCNIYNCGILFVILRYYIVYVSIFIFVFVFMWWVFYIDVFINVMVVLMSFFLLIVYFIKMDVMVVLVIESWVGLGWYLVVWGCEMRWFGWCLIVFLKILLWVIIIW